MEVIWHRVDEELPPKSGNYLGSTIGRSTGCFHFGAGSKDWEFCGRTTKEVFFWTEIPFPPDECMIGVTNEL